MAKTAPGAISISEISRSAAERRESEKAPYRFTKIPRLHRCSGRCSVTGSSPVTSRNTSCPASSRTRSTAAALISGEHTPAYPRRPAAPDANMETYPGFSVRNTKTAPAAIQQTSMQICGPPNVANPFISDIRPLRPRRASLPYACGCASSHAMISRLS